MNVDIPTILAVGGGKGGTGKSTFAVCLASQLAIFGRDVVLADLDFGAANLHIMLGMRDNGRSLVRFLYPSGQAIGLEECIVSTTIDGLRLLPGEGFMPGIANMEFAKKQKLIKALRKVETDYVICDLGSGSSFNVVDFFLAADRGILLLTAEATAILNGYEFMKNCIFRKIARSFVKDQTIMKIVNEYRKGWEGGSRGSIGEMIGRVGKKFPDAARQMQELCNEFTPVMLLNMANMKKGSLGVKLDALSRKYLNIKIEYLGAMVSEPALQVGILSFLKKETTSLFKENLKDIVGHFLNKERI